MENKKEFPYLGSFKIKTEELSCEIVLPKRILVNSIPMDLKEPIEIGAQDNVLLDFEEEYLGELSYELNGSGILKAIYGESLEEPYSDSKDNSNEWYSIPTDELAVNGKNVFITKRRAFRYIRLIATKGKIFIEGINLRFTHRNMKPIPLDINDTILNRIYKICERTVFLCNQNFMEDGIKRDGILWVSDARILAICSYSMFNYSAIVKEGLKYIAESQTHDGKIFANAIISGAHIVPDKIDYMFDFANNKKPEGPLEGLEGCGFLHYIHYSLDFVNISYEYYEQTKDMDFINQLYPFLKRTLDYLFCLSQKEEIEKLLPPPEQAMKARNSVDQGGYLSTYYASMVYTLNNFKIINSLFGYDNKSYDEKIKLYTNKCLKFFNSELFIDKDKHDRPGIPLSALTMAYFSGIIDKKTFANSYLKHKKEFSYIVDGYWKYWTIRAMCECGLKDDAHESIVDYWGCMLDHGATTCWEQFDRENLYILKDFVISRCHGWSAGAGDLIKRFF